jgi:hypothetical protein
MLERAPDAPLITFRLQERPDGPGLESFTAERLPDHRRAYLDYEGPVSNGRGRVEKLTQGICTRLEESFDRLDVVCLFESSPGVEHHYLGRAEGDGRWRFTRRVTPTS